MKFNDLDELNLFLAESISDDLLKYGLITNQLTSDTLHIQTADRDVSIFVDWFKTTIFVTSEGLDNIDINCPNMVNEETAEHILSFFNKLVENVGETVLQGV